MQVKRFLLALSALLFAASSNAVPIGIYWTDSVDGTVNRAALDGSGQETLVSGLAKPGGMFVSDDNIYWTDRDDSAVWRSGPDGSAASILISAPGSPRDVAVTEDSIYFVSTGAFDSVSKANLDGSGTTALVTSDLSFPNGIALHNGNIYWSDSGKLSIKRSDMSGAGITEVVFGLSETMLPDDVFVTDDFVYWSTRDLALTRTGPAIPGTIQRARLDGSEISTLIDDLIFPQHLVVAGAYIYWTDQNAGKIQRANLDGSGITDLVTGLSNPVGLAVITPVPEPSTLGLLGAGLFGLIVLRRKRTS